MRQALPRRNIARFSSRWYVFLLMPISPAPAARRGVQLSILAGLVVSLAGACSLGGATGGADPDVDALVTYERVWRDGYTERQVVDVDGRVTMWHGDRFERLTLSEEDIDLIAESLEGDMPTGSPDDSPARTLILDDGTVIDHPRPAPGSITELMDQLMDTHTSG